MAEFEGGTFLRPGRQALAGPERVWMPKATADERSRALSKLGDGVLIMRHPYQRDPGSGAGNCWCGRHQSHSLHDVVIEPEWAAALDVPGRATELLRGTNVVGRG